MAHQDFDAFRSSQLSRKPSGKSKRRLLQLSLTGDHAAPPQESFYGERRKGTSAVARVIFIIVLLHILVVGGTCLHKKLQSDENAVAESTTPPPAQTPVEVAPPTITPLPVAKTDDAQPDTATITGNTAPILPTVTPAAIPTLPPVAGTSTAEPAEITAVEVPAPAVIQPTPAPAPAPVVSPAAEQPLVVTSTRKHTIVAGDTWYSLAKKNNITIEQLRAANPVDGKKNDVYAGKTILIPVYGKAPANSAPAAVASKPVAAPSSKTPKTYTVVSGDTLYRIANKNKVSVDTILKLNNIDKKDAGKIRVGQQLKLAE